MGALFKPFMFNTVVAPFLCGIPDLRVTRVDTGAVEARLVISKALTNSYGTLHGGAAATLVDIAGTCVLAKRVVWQHTTDSFCIGLSARLSSSTCYPLTPIPSNAGFSMALLSKDPLRAGVSVEINTTYMAAVPIGEEVLIKGRLLKSGRRMGFTTVDIYRADGSIAVTGRHTKAL